MTNHKSKDDEINFLFTCLENSKNLDLPAVAKALNLPNLKSAQNRLYSLKVKYGRPGVSSTKATTNNSTKPVDENGSPVKNGGVVPANSNNTSPTKRKEKDVLSPRKPRKVTKPKPDDSPTKSAMERLARVKMEESLKQQRTAAADSDSDAESTTY